MTRFKPLTGREFERMLEDRGLGHVLELLELGRRWPNIVATSPSTLTQFGYRARFDDGSETTATWQAAENTNWRQVVGVTFRLRIGISESTTGTIPQGAVIYKLQCNKNSAGWNDVTTASTIAKLVTSVNVADATPTTAQLTSAAPFVAGAIDSSGNTVSVTIGQGNHTEFEFVVQIVGTDVAPGDAIQFRVVKSSGTVMNFYTQTPTATVSSSPQPRVVGQSVMRAATRAVGRLRGWVRGSDGVLVPEIA